MEAPIVNLELIQKLRKEKGISVEKMSLLLGFEGYQGYYYKERGTRKLTADEIAKIATILGVPIGSLFFEQIVTEKVI